MIIIIWLFIIRLRHTLYVSKRLQSYYYPGHRIQLVIPAHNVCTSSTPWGTLGRSGVRTHDPQFTRRESESLHPGSSMNIINNTIKKKTLITCWSSSCWWDPIFDSLFVFLEGSLRNNVGLRPRRTVYYINSEHSIVQYTGFELSWLCTTYKTNIPSTGLFHRDRRPRWNRPARWINLYLEFI